MHSSFSTYPLVSVITVNYNQPQVTREFLDSFHQITYPNYEVFVVDNGSPQHDVKPLEPDYPWVKFIYSKENLGFAGGNNVAIQQAKGEYLLLLNNDTEVPKGFLEPLVKVMQSNPQIGMASPKIKYFYEDNLIQYAGAPEISVLTGRGEPYGKKQKDEGQYDKSGPTSYIHGAAVIVSKKVLEKTGSMHDDYFLYYEELDWCKRCRNDGFLVWYVAESTVLHKESVSTGRNSPLKMYYLTRNRLWFMKRNFKIWQWLISFSFFTFISIPKNLLVFLKNRQFEYFKPFLNGYLQSFKG
ncbi:glycosyltransferase family 2 protein [Flectobacillus roseus]|uniref:Glycosyltransferase family 2 protein n=1 Tax=Flectobacillus roseus TaxID=502259 RepID=A0ABT6Y530_9BACT|nr:glycosyltransferase family 2 protein [Flectobacillus roseus]MDI9858678.1 glycosyltransferase family 2 protein [Flectobacillus roseus]